MSQDRRLAELERRIQADPADEIALAEREAWVQRLGVEDAPGCEELCAVLRWHGYDLSRGAAYVPARFRYRPRLVLGGRAAWHGVDQVAERCGLPVELLRAWVPPIRYRMDAARLPERLHRAGPLPRLPTPRARYLAQLALRNAIARIDEVPFRLDHGKEHAHAECIGLRVEGAGGEA